MVGDWITGFLQLTSNLNTLPADKSIIFDIAMILIISAIFAFIARSLKQPLIPAYVITGLIAGPLVFGLVKNTSLIYAFSEIGIAFLLFTAGLEISFKKIKEANLKKIFLIGFFQVILVFLIAFFAGKLINLNLIQSVYIGIILAFSSTMVVVKLLSDKNELVTMHGRLILGILLLQDLFAIFAVAILMSNDVSISLVVGALLKLLSIIAIAFILHLFVLNKLFRFAARSLELLLLSSLAVLFLFVLLAYFFNLSIVIGAFIAGISLANSQFKLELESRISSLRDFFAILFFVSLGMQIVLTNISSTFNLLIFMFLGAILVKPFITLILLRVSGYRPKTSFLTALSLGQLSEFSLIIGMIGLSFNVFDSTSFSAIVLVTMISITLTSYSIKYENHLYLFFRKPLKMLRFLPVKENLEYIDKKEKTVLLIGCHRMGSVLLKELIKDKDDIIVIDHNPEIVNSLIKKKISCIYGDLSSPEILDNLELEKFNLVISTLPNEEDNLFLLKKIKHKNRKTKVILTADKIDDALGLYAKGADYVILPKVIAGEELSQIINESSRNLEIDKKKHIQKLKNIHNILY
ncbi:MAG: cation:proton antiporter [Nanoarchaeota archaeon]|nr:cation:proton antiporter [Nanoarchaeota archaeon]